ncbi:hypothetical protein TWF718_010662 [Orbilia javanica]|uniref:CCAAT-binding factor domain-containing protein n=1 Tax=Orbilia javanica TaxID=47235 RepID=A0AAN8MMC0_9PEZI
MAKDSKKQKTDSSAAESTAQPGFEIPDSNFLSKLTQRIEAGVKESKGASKSKKEQKEQKPKDRTAAPPSTRQNGARIQVNGKSSQLAQSSDDTRGKKRDRTGSVIDNKAAPAKKTHIKFDDDGKTTATVEPSKATKKDNNAPTKSEGSKSKKDVLLQEIMALGGTQEDLDLVGELDTDSDQEETVVKETGKVTNATAKDIEAFMKEIGLTAAVSEAAKSVDEAEVAEEEEEWTEDEEGEGEGEGEDEDTEDGEENESDGDNDDEPDQGPTVPAKTAPSRVLTQLPSKGPLVLDPQQDWHNIVLPELPSASDTPTPFAISSLHTRGKDLLTAENSSYMSNNLKRDTNLQFLSQIMTSGTVEDKISALTIVCTDSPLHTTKTLESLLGLAKKKSRNQTIGSLTAIKDLFANGSVLPSDRKLLPFAKQPVGELLAYEKSKGADQVFKAYLLLWSFEDWLKDFYFEVLKIMEIVANDAGVTWVRMKAVEMVFELLKQKPEGEVNLMRLLVNKLGDPDRKVASKTSHLLLQLMVAHPAMKSTIISSIESDALLKSSKNAHAKYYSIITLNQTILTRADDSVANQLLNIYFAQFADILGGAKKPMKPIKPKPDGKLSKKAKKRLDKEKKDADLEEESNSKLISAVLAGVNRAFPFASIDDDVFNKHLDTLFRITHGSNFNTSLQALTLIFQVSNSKQMVSDRFYRSLYESLVDPRLATSSKQAMYLNLLFRALKADHKLVRVQAFVKRIVQTASMHQPPFICGVLYLLRELEGTYPTLKNMLDKPIDYDSDEEVFRDVDDERDAGVSKPEEPKKESNGYDGRKRDPLYANADRSSLWELIPFLSHFHPTVGLYANSLYGDAPMPSKPDLSLHTLTHFLDRFVYRNAKASSTTKGSSIMQPLVGGDTRGMVLNTKTAGRGLLPVNSDAFSNMKEENVKEDEVFFHKFFTMRKQSDASKSHKKEKEKKKADDEEEDSEFDDEEAWGAMVDSRPDLDIDDDADMDDFDDDDLDGMDEDMSDIDGDSDEDGEEGGMGGLTTDALGGMDDEDMDEDNSDDEEEEEFDGFGLDDSDAEAGINSDDDVPSDVDVKLSKVAKSGKEAANNARKERRTKLKNLPTFASIEDYAALLGDDDEEDM